MKPSRKDQVKKLEREILLNSIQSKEGIHELVLILDHLKAGFNIAKIIRTAEIFSLNCIHIIGTKEFNPFPAKGAIRRVSLKFFDKIEDSIMELQSRGYTIYTLDTHTDNFLHRSKIPKKSAFIFGNEETGPSVPSSFSKCIKKIKIKQFGKTESLNVSVAASIASYEYIRQHSLI